MKKELKLTKKHSDVNSAVTDATGDVCEKHLFRCKGVKYTLYSLHSFNCEDVTG